MSTTNRYLHIHTGMHEFVDEVVIDITSETFSPNTKVEWILQQFLKFQNKHHSFAICKQTIFN